MNPRPSVRLVALCSTVLLGVALARAGASTAYYDGDDPRPEPLKYDDATLRATLVQQLKKQGVTSVQGAGVGAEDMARLGRVEQLALLSLASTRPGAELDVMVEQDGAFTPVQGQWNGTELTLRKGPPRTELYGKAPTVEALRSRYQLGPFVEDGAAWDAASLSVVDAALATLRPAELPALVGVAFHRMVKDPASKVVRGTAIAMYRPVEEGPRIELYNHGVDADRRKFLGAVGHPHPLSVGAMVHELAHAVARKALVGQRLKVVQAAGAYEALRNQVVEGKKTYDALKETYTRTKDAALVKDLNARAAELKAQMAQMATLQRAFEEQRAALVAQQARPSELESALDRVLPFAQSPTVYGRTAPGESFAECFMLHRLDREALDRAAPAVGPWFDSPAYAALLGP